MLGTSAFSARTEFSVTTPSGLFFVLNLPQASLFS